MSRKLRWNVRIRSADDVTSFGWYGSAEKAVAGLKYAVGLMRQYVRNLQVRLKIEVDEALPQFCVGTQALKVMAGPV